MSDTAKYQGVIPAFYACYDRDGAIDGARYEELARYFADIGVKGVYVGGSSGECIYQSPEERKRALEAVVRAVKGKITIIAHVACNNTADSCALAAHAQSLGVDAIAAIPPIYFKLPEHAIAKYWNDISDAAPETDFFIYNIPQLAGVSLTQPLYKEMLKNPRVRGVKNSSMPTMDIQVWKSMKPDNIVFNGPDEQFVAGLMIGADGGIGGTYAVMPELFLKAEKAVRAGEVSEAQRLQNIINDIIFRMNSGKSNMYALAKEIIRQRVSIDLGDARAPLYPLQKEDIPIAQECVRIITEALA